MRLLSFLFVVLGLSGRVFGISDYCQNQHRLRTQKCDRAHSRERKICLKRSISKKHSCKLHLKRSRLSCARKYKAIKKRCQTQVPSPLALERCHQEAKKRLLRCVVSLSLQKNCHQQAKKCQKACTINQIVSCVKSCRDKQVSCLYKLEDKESLCRWKTLKKERHCKRLLVDKELKRVFDCLYHEEQQYKNCQRESSDIEIKCLYDVFMQERQCLRQNHTTRRNCYMSSLSKLRICK